MNTHGPDPRPKVCPIWDNPKTPPITTESYNLRHYDDDYEHEPRHTTPLIAYDPDNPDDSQLIMTGIKLFTPDKWR